MTRVLYINHTNVIGGAETNLVSILEATHATSIMPVAVLLPDPGILAEQVSKMNIPVGFVSYYGWRSRNPLRYLWTLWQLISWVKRTHAEIIHLNHHWLAEYAVTVGRLTGIPVVCHVRGLLDRQSITGFDRWLNWADRVLTVSDAALDRLISLGISPKHTQLIRDGINLDKFQALENTVSEQVDPSMGASGPVIGFIGRLVPEKGIEDFLRAAVIVHQCTPEARFYIVGQDQDGGKYTESLRQLTHNLLPDNNVCFAGFRADIPSVLRLMNICVIPSRIEMPEGLPLTVIEAMAAGCLVVATPISGIVEVVHDQETGLLVPPNDPNALAQGIWIALNLPLTQRESIVHSAKLLVREQFSIQRQVQELECLYHSVLDERRARSL